MPEAFDDALRRRLQLINSFGEQANAQASAIAARRQQQAQQQQQYMGVPQADTGFNNSATGRGDFGSFLRAISGRESGNNYSARNRDSGALGKYQIMPGNIPSWSREALGYGITARQFYQSPQLQEQIAQFKLRQYYNKGGPEYAAVAWYAGPGTANKYMRQGGRGYNAKQGKYSSISAYALGILRAMGLR
jgi:hypothetical protein